MKIRVRTLVLGLPIILVGCAAPVEVVKPVNERIESGLIESKQDFENSNSFRRGTTYVPLPGVLLPIPTGSPQRKGRNIGYQVKTVSGETITAVSMFDGFKVGDCVRVFRSDNLPPRLGNGHDCSDLK